MASAPSHPAHLALYLDTWLSGPLTAHVIERCRELDAELVCLAPPPGGLAVARLEPHVAALEGSGVTWRMQPVGGDPASDLRGLPAPALLVCESGSALARYRGDLPAPLLILLNPETELVRNKPAIRQAVDWLEPRLHRGF